MTAAPSPVVNDSTDDEGYLIRDGEPVAETGFHLWAMFDTIGSLDVHFAERPDVYVGGNNFIHYKENDRTRYVSPDAYVVFHVNKRIRDNYKVWQEGGHIPAITFEFTSRETRQEDVDRKFVLYRDELKVPEYILFDPKGEYLKPRFQGYRLNADGEYVAIPIVDGRMVSEQLDLYMEADGVKLRFFDAKTGEYLRTMAEESEERKEAVQIAAQERARAVQERQARLAEERRAEQAAQRAEQETQARLAETQRAETETAARIAETKRADQECEARIAERQRAEEEHHARIAATQRAEQEVKARQEAEAENARLRAEIAALRQARDNGQN